MTTKHYVIVRDDLPRGTLAAMVVHAAGITGGRHAIGAHAVVLAVPNADAMLSVAAQLATTSVAHHIVTEPDAPWCGAPMAIGIEPMIPTDELRSVTRKLKLLTNA